MMARLSCMKLSVHLTKHSPKPILRILRSTHPLATLEKVEATSIRRAPVMQPLLHTSWVCTIVTPTVSTADRLALQPYRPGLSEGGAL